MQVKVCNHPDLPSCSIHHRLGVVSQAHERGLDMSEWKPVIEDLDYLKQKYEHAAAFSHDKDYVDQLYRQWQDAIAQTERNEGLEESGSAPYLTTDEEPWASYNKQEYEQRGQWGKLPTRNIKEARRNSYRYYREAILEHNEGRAAHYAYRVSLMDAELERRNRRDERRGKR